MKARLRDKNLFFTFESVGFGQKVTRHPKWSDDRHPLLLSWLKHKMAVGNQADADEDNQHQHLQLAA